MQRSQSTSTHRFFLKKILRRSRREEKAQETREMAEGQSTTSNRWNPTSEQIALLEATYSEGLRTPNPDQIEQIASRLRMYGNIEGKSVFYWFQNRKARERQRQKQERVPSINQFLQPPSLAGTSHRNKVLSTEQKSAAVMPKMTYSRIPVGSQINGTTDDNQTANTGNLSELPTLELFPLHPSGMARANPQSGQESRNVSRSNDSRSGAGHFQNFFHFIPRHPGN